MGQTSGSSKPDGCAGELPDYWYHDRDALVREVNAHGSYVDIERFHGVASSTLSTWWSKHQLPRRKTGHAPAHGEAFSISTELEAEVLRQLKKLGDECTLVDLSNACDVSPARIQETLEKLGHEGYRVEEHGQQVKLHRMPIPSGKEHEILFAGEEYRFGIVSDPHLNSKHCRLQELHIAYDRLQAEGIETVYNPGDIVSGRGVYRGQDHEIINHTYADQVEFAVENYPRRDGMETLIISGNHDCEGDFGRAGADACLGVANRRDDITWCGRYEADFRLPQGTLMTMRHPMGGGSYASSYTPQKFAESFEGGDKPNVMLFGHWHDMLYMVERNIHMLKCGTFEGGGNSLGKRKPLGAPAVGFWLVEMTVADDASVVRFRPEWFPFYKGRRATSSFPG